MQTKSLTICGFNLLAPLRYTPGEPLGENEASTLNSLLHKDVAGKVKVLIEKGEVAEGDIQAKFNELASAFQFTKQIRLGPDPVRKEAQKIARPLLEKALAKRGTDISQFSEDKLAPLFDQIFAKRPDIIEEAQRRILAIKDFASSALAD
jgi:hypothetical protein